MNSNIIRFFFLSFFLYSLRLFFSCCVRLLSVCHCGANRITISYQKYEKKKYEKLNKQIKTEQNVLFSSSSFTTSLRKRRQTICCYIVEG